MNLLNPTFYPIQYSLSSPSKHIIIHHEDDLSITQEYLYQSATPSRFYYNQEDRFCFVIKGEIYLQQNEQEMVLKKHQGVWLTSKNIHTATLLSPVVELCFIRFKKIDTPSQEVPFKKLSSGSVESAMGKNQIKTWPLWKNQTGSITLEVYPPHYKETPYYQKLATQYFLPLGGNILLSYNKGTPMTCEEIGKVIPPKTPRAIHNPEEDSISVLSVTTESSKKGRVLLLKKPN